MSDLRVNMMRRTFAKNHIEAVTIVKDITSGIIADVMHVIEDRLHVLVSPTGLADTVGESESDEHIGDFVAETLSKLSNEMIAETSLSNTEERPATPEVFDDKSYQEPMDDDENYDFVDDLVQVTLTKVSREIINDSNISPPVEVDDNTTAPLVAQTDCGTVKNRQEETDGTGIKSRSFLERFLDIFQKKNHKEGNNDKQKKSIKEKFRNMASCFRRHNKVGPSTAED